MNYEVHIREVSSGVVRVCKDEWMVFDEATVYLWSDGNYSCDCNRYLFFERAAGGDPELGDHPCNTTKEDAKYRVDAIILDDGTKLYLDGE